MKKKLYCVVDTETATMPFANELANGDSERKKKIAIARPLVYDFGYTICDRMGNIYEKKQFLIAETFSVPSVFNTAYYAEKRPIYLDMIERGEITVKPWNEVMNIWLHDIENIDGVGAFNSMFDFKKAIPFTELYIRKLYSKDYFEWEKIQRNLCYNIMMNGPRKNKNEFDNDGFVFRGKRYPLFDLWGLATTHLLNNVSYKKNCISYDMFTNSGTFFKTSAESAYRYLCDKYDFIESHTALDDATIETFILSKIANRHAITMGIKYFPFRDLGTTYDFCQRRKVPDFDECRAVYEAMARYIDSKEDRTAYVVGVMNRLNELAAYCGWDCEY